MLVSSSSSPVTVTPPRDESAGCIQTELIGAIIGM